MPDDGSARVVRAEEAPALSRGDAVVSRLLHGAASAEGETELTVTWVTVEPGSAQTLHSHPPEQVYVVVAGTGTMRVGDERHRVSAGDLVHVPSGVRHGIENTGDGSLEYVSAATPAIPPERVDAFYDAER